MAAVTVSATPMNTSTSGPKPKPLMVSVKTFEGKEGESLLLWTREPELAMGSALLKTEHQRVALAIPRLGGRAREWALTCGTSVETSFSTWEQLKQQLSRCLWRACRRAWPGRKSSATHPTSFEEAVNVALNAEFNFKSSRLGWNASYANPSSGPEPMNISYAEDEEAELHAAEQRTGRPTGEELTSVEPHGGGGQQALAPKRAVLSNTERVCKPGLLVIQATVKGFEKPWTILVDSGASGNYTRRSMMEGSQLYAEALKARNCDIVTVHLATGTRVTVPKVPVDLGVKFLDFDSVERCLVLVLDARYDLVLGMARLARHKPWIDWRSKTLGATHFSPSGALASHEPTSPRKQKRFWREHWTEMVNVLDIGMSEMMDTESVVDKSPEQSSWAERGAVHNPLSITRGEAASLHAHEGMDRSPERSSWTERGVARNPLSDARGEAASLHAHEGMVGSEPRHQVCGPSDACGVAQNPLSEARMDYEPSLGAKDGMVGVTPKTQGRSPAVDCGVAHNSLSEGCGQSSTSLSVGRDTEVPSELEEVMTPEGAAGASTTASRRRTTSAKRRRRRKMLAARRMASGISRDVNGVVSGTALHDSQQLYTLVNGVTADVDGDINLGAVPTSAARLDLDEMSFDEFGEALQAGELTKVVVIRPKEELNSSSILGEAVLEDAKRRRRSMRDVVSKEPPSGLPPDRGVRHEIDLVPGTKYCVTRQWPLPREQCDVIDAFFRAKHEAGLVCESKSPHSTHTFCVRKPNGKWPDPAKVKAIVEWLVPRDQKDVRKWLGLANNLHKYSENYAEMAWPLSNLLKKGAEWRWNAEHQDAFEAIKESLLHAPILALPDPDRPFSVVCDASDFAIGCALLQADAEGRERVIAFESRQLKAA
ncbi:unnamed protein product [Phytophthora fragariaefolia]|uniref:Unnamed protein product n=1 Tax=Phytophthora fragariaefolia TaxID=1490495 RepID=A0A9W7CVR1_9STRA|nr:unnamed protein product [Phytophthora fragariaefolia]